MRLLVVEDETRLASYLKRGLAAEGFAVDVANDGEQGLWLATEQAYDLILLDIMIPKVSGYEVLKRLREAGNWTAVLMLTAKDGEYDEADALDLGADDYLTKPFSFIVLLAHIRALLRRGAPERPTVLRVGDLTLDPASRAVRRGDDEIKLTAKEFSLLEFLMRRPGEVHSKREILEHVWDWEFDGDPNIIEVYVGYLRRKIDAPFDCDTLRTVRGAGYRLDSNGR
jgi:DNA-binding response OmpR family regulator